MKALGHLFLIIISSVSFCALCPSQINAKPTENNVLLAKVYQPGTDLQQYLVSEKYDGVRAIWDGKNFHSRTNHTIAAPAWFTKDLPNTALDGELWLGHGKFEALSGAVRKKLPVDQEWQGISYMVFELPNAKGTFAERAKTIVNIVNRANSPYLKAVKQMTVHDEAALNKLLKQTVAQGGEGLMLHRADALYVTGRSDALLKLKLLYDAEAKVVAHTAGKGKYKGQLGALEVVTAEGVHFKLGTGFTDAQRRNPPKIGSTVTFTYLDKTKAGKPKFASFLRVRNDQ